MAITINGITAHPHQQAAELAAAGLTSQDAGASNFILVQTTAPLTSEQRQALLDAGAAIIEYVPDDTYICKFEANDLGPIRALPFVSWVNVYMQDFKIAPALREDDPTVTTANLLDLAPHQDKSKERITVDVVFQGGQGTQDLAKQIATAAGADPNLVQLSGNKVRITVERRRLADIAKIDEIRHIEPYVAPQLFNNVARQVVAAELAQSGGVMQGEGQVVCVCDTGFDMGSTSNVHPAFKGRVKKLYALGRPNKADDPDGHGTHVCGSVLGDGKMVDGTVVRGIAPAATLVMQSVLDSGNGLGGLPDRLGDLFGPPYVNDGARVHSNSWGSNVSGTYTTNASEIDAFVWAHRDLVVCVAAGNAGSDAAGTGVVAAASVGSPATAKNCIAVGASENRRPNFTPVGSARALTYGLGWHKDFPKNPIKSDQVADNPNGMVAFSSRGPAQNGRVRPDVVAPGTAILSTKSRAATDDGWSASPDPAFFYDGGTSMATPLVSGCAAVTRQFLTSKGVAGPSAALVKAMLINGADILTGQYVPREAGSPPDNSQGFGRVNLKNAVGPHPAGTTVDFVDEAGALDTGQSAQHNINLADSSDLKITLVWTDPAGEALQNDLDLIVTTADGQEHHGNIAAPAQGFDRTNNVEQVIVIGAAAGGVGVTVRSYRSVQPQSYALVTRVAKH